MPKKATSNKDDFLTRLRAIQKEIAQKRDELHELVSEVEDLLSDVSDAHESLEYAIDALSRMQQNP